MIFGAPYAAGVATVRLTVPFDTECSQIILKSQTFGMYEAFLCASTQSPEGNK